VLFRVKDASRYLNQSLRRKKRADPPVTWVTSGGLQQKIECCLSAAAPAWIKKICAAKPGKYAVTQRVPLAIVSARRTGDAVFNSFLD